MKGYRDLPVNMQIKGGARDDPNADPWNHAITYVIGDGQWLQKDPTSGLDAAFKETYKRLRESLAVTLLRLGRKAVVVINERDDNEKHCNSKDKDHRNNIWDPDRKICYGLWRVDMGKTGSLAPLRDPAYPLWEKYNGDGERFEGVRSDQGGFGVDMLTFYRNVIDCWESNDAKLGFPKANLLQPGTATPRCMYTLEVKKGGYRADKDRGCWGSDVIILDTNFPNFPKDSIEKKNNKVWPIEKQLISPFCLKDTNYP